MENPIYSHYLMACFMPPCSVIESTVTCRWL